MIIPFGSVGGCHSRVTEEAVTFVKVTFCGGLNGSDAKGMQKLETTMMFSVKNLSKVLPVTCIYGGETDINHHSSISQSGPA